MVKAASVAWRPLTHDAERWFVSLMGCLTAFMSDASIDLVEDGTLLGPRRFDMGNSGLGFVGPPLEPGCAGSTRTFSLALNAA